MKPPPKPKDDLAEVERALSVLQGRHPELERIRREEDQKSAQRRAERDASASVAERDLRMRRAKIGGVVVVILSVAGLVGTLFQRELARRGRIEQSSDAYRAMGFRIVDTSSRGAPGAIESATEDGCFLATSTDAAALKLTAAGQSFTGAAPAVFCTCQSGKVTVTSDVAPGGGLTLLQVAPAMIGGSQAFAFLPFAPGATSSATDAACSDTYLDAWLTAKRAPSLAPETTWLKADPKRATLAASGAKILGQLPANKPFAVFDAPPSSCVVASSETAGDKLSIRMNGGAMLVTSAPGSFVWCAANAFSAMIQREGKGAVTLVAVPAVAVGGMYGLRELAKDAGLVLGFTGMPASDHAWNAKSLLLASAVPEQLVTVAPSSEVPPEPEARLAALSFATPGALVADLPTDVFSYCEPGLPETSGEALCIFSAAQTWRTGGAAAVGGIARAKLPFWLFGLQTASDPVAMKMAASLATLARRLKREGFEPTTLDAVTEKPTGVDVLGRSNEDAIVAVGLAPVAPWVFPYSDGPAWTLGGPPRVIALKPTLSVSLTTSAKPLPPKEKRRTVVFRRPVR